MKRKLLIAVPLLCLVGLVAWWFRPKHETLGEAFVSERSVTLWGRVAQVREPLLSVLRIRPDFRPAYDPLILMAGMLARSDVVDASALLKELMQIQPARPEAGAALRQIGNAASP